MEFGLSSEQLLLQESVRKCLDRVMPLERVQAYTREGTARAEGLWQALCELGIPGMLIDDTHGGLGCSMLDAAVVAEMFGSGAAPAPLVASVVLAPLALASAGSEEQQATWLGEMATGQAIVGAAITEAVSSREGAKVEADGSTLHGRALFVIDFEADAYLVADASKALYLVAADAPRVKRVALATVDKTRHLGELVFDGAEAQLLPGSTDGAVCDRLIDAGRVILAADTLGAAETMLNRAIAYSKERVQFGRAIGSFQAVKHMCAEMAAALEPCRAMVWYAAHALDEIESEARLTACHTKAHLAEVGTQVARTATEVHGGIGFTDELGLHLWFKRIGVNRQLLGGPERVREEAARLQGFV